MDDKSTYRFVRQDDMTAFGTTHRFVGPNLSRWNGSIHLLQPFNEWSQEKWLPSDADSDAQSIVYLLNAAYEAGRKSMQQDIKHMLGINKP